MWSQVSTGALRSGSGFLVVRAAGSLGGLGVSGGTEDVPGLRQYRLGDGAKDGGASVYVLARDDLMRWYHLEGLSGVELTDKYRSVHGVYAHPTPLTKWLKAPAQALVCLDNNEDP